jgi:hypothetical protein
MGSARAGVCQRTWLKRVLMTPGAMALTWMLAGASSTASTWVSMMSAGFGDGVDAHRGRGPQAGHRGDVDDFATALGLHMGRHGLRHPEGGLHVGIQDFIPLALVGGENGAEVGVGGRVVDGDVYPAEGLQGPGDQCLHLFGLPDVGLYGQRFAASGADFLRHRPDVLPFAAGDDDPGPRAGQAERDGPPDAARRAGNQRDFAVKG